MISPCRLHERDVVLLAELLRVGRFVPDQAQTRNAAAFLIDRDDRFDVAQVAQIVDQLPQLRRARDVAAKQNVAARLHAAEERGGCGIEFRAGHAGEEELSELIAPSGSASF